MRMPGAMTDRIETAGAAADGASRAVSEAMPESESADTPGG